jgi:hypothetical protein
MVRKLDKIEKEMGYCEIKLEKERRLRRQAGFLRSEVEVLNRFIQRYDGAKNSLTDLAFPKIGRQIELERQSRDTPGPVFRRAKEEFIAAGVVEVVSAEREILEREADDLGGKFENYSGFGQKREILENEKRQALTSVAAQLTPRVRKLNDDFKRIEQLWNSLTEDALNLDEGLFFLSRNVDYLKSSRSFLVAAKGSFDVETWVEDGHAGNLFRHSNVGRAREMIDGANRNLKLAQKEFVCIINLKFEIDGFEPVLFQFLDALFDDIFLDTRLDRTLHVVEFAIKESEKRLQRTRQRREQLHRKLERAEWTRVSLFQRLGGERRGRVAVS